MRNSVWREERSSDFTDKPSWCGQVETALLWTQFSNECNVPSRPPAGDNIIISLGSKTIIYSLSPNWMLET